MQGGERREKAGNAGSVGGECPVCGHRLQGSRYIGFSCGKCGSHFSGKFITRLRRREFSERIAAHFEPARQTPAAAVMETREEFVVEDDGRIQEMIDHAHIAVRRVSAVLAENVDEATVALEDIVGTNDTIAEDPAIARAGPAAIDPGARRSAAKAKSAARSRGGKRGGRRTVARAPKRRSALPVRSAVPVSRAARSLKKRARRSAPSRAVPKRRR